MTFRNAVPDAVMMLAVFFDDTTAVIIATVTTPASTSMKLFAFTCSFPSLV